MFYARESAHSHVYEEEIIIDLLFLSFHERENDDEDVVLCVTLI